MTSVFRTCILSIALLGLGIPSISAEQSPAERRPPSPLPPIKPFTYVDPATRIIFYVESDGRHLSAIAPDGKILWARNPYIDIGSHHYRRNEQIVHLGPLSATYTRHMQRERKNPGPFIAIAFDSTQFGAIDVRNGDFSNLGQD
jgi:hypothetical protein